MLLLDRRELLTPADHQTHRRYAFTVPEDCSELQVRVHYAPKFVSASESARLLHQTVSAQVRDLAARVGHVLADDWARDFATAELIVPNLLTVSLDDAHGTYRGAGHRHTPDQQLGLGVGGASPGLVAGPLPAGSWLLTLSVHTLVSAQCEAEIQIGAETASSRP